MVFNLDVRRVHLIVFCTQSVLSPAYAIFIPVLVRCVLHGVGVTCAKSLCTSFVPLSCHRWVIAVCFGEGYNLA